MTDAGETETKEAGNQPDFADGVYFNMPHSEYLRLKRLSNSAMQNLDQGAAYYWANSSMNRDYDDESTAAMKYGRAYHMAALEPELFAKSYAPEFSDELMGDGAVTNATEIGLKLETLGEKKKLTGEKVADQAWRLSLAGFPANKIKHLAEGLHYESHEGREFLPFSSLQQIERDVAAMEHFPEVLKFLRMGFSEVTILWTDEKTGEKMKARLDRVWSTGFSDLKTFDNMLGKRLDQCLSDAIKYRRYHMQVATYFTAVELWRAGKIPLAGDCSDDQAALYDAVRDNPRRMECYWIWQEKKGIPNFIATIMETHSYDVYGHNANRAGIDEDTNDEIIEKLKRPSGWFMRGLNDMRHAISVYRLAMETFGPDKPWNDVMPVRKISDDSFSSFWLDE